MRHRWHDVVIVLAIIALAAGGFWAIWGEDILGDDDDAGQTDSSAP